MAKIFGEIRSGFVPIKVELTAEPEVLVQLVSKRLELMESSEAETLNEGGVT